MRIADGVPVKGIATSLDPIGAVEGEPARLVENFNICFQGCIVLGKGFIIDRETRDRWLAEQPDSAEVVLPYMIGDDLNSNSKISAGRWVVNFGERTAREAQQFESQWLHLRQLVRPVRVRKDGAKYPRMVHEWWKFWNSRPALQLSLKKHEEVLAITRLSDTLMLVRVSSAAVFSEQVIVFAVESPATQAVLSSSMHQLWVLTHGSAMRNHPRYTTDAFITLPRPESTDELERRGRVLDQERQEMMLRRDLGLTKLYNLINDPDIADSADADVARLRQIHVELDRAVMDAYGWGDVPLDHGFHTYRQMTRWTVSPAARVEILDRLLEENHRRAALQRGAPPPADDDGLGDEGGDD